jgi:hypothetical protein
MAPTVNRLSWALPWIVGVLIGFTTLPVYARPSPLLHPSPRALAQGDDEPPLKRQGAPVVKQEPSRVVVDDPPIYKKWWFWALTAAVVGGTVAFGALTFKSADPVPRACPPSTILCFGDGRPE